MDLRAGGVVAATSGDAPALAASAATELAATSFRNRRRERRLTDRDGWESRVVSRSSSPEERPSKVSSPRRSPSGIGMLRFAGVVVAHLDRAGLDHQPARGLLADLVAERERLGPEPGAADPDLERLLDQRLRAEVAGDAGEDERDATVVLGPSGPSKRLQYSWRATSR